MPPAGSPYGILAVPGRDLGLQLLLRREPDVDRRRADPAVPGGRHEPGRDAACRELHAPLALAKGDDRVARTSGLTVELRDVDEYTLLIAKRDPGQGIVWLAFASLIAGITITFYLPRRRVWTRLTADGRLGIVWRSDRYVDVEREFGRLLDRPGRRPAAARGRASDPAGCDGSSRGRGRDADVR